jgi:hypothetical protein
VDGPSLHSSCAIYDECCIWQDLSLASGGATALVGPQGASLGIGRSVGGPVRFLYSGLTVEAPDVSISPKVGLPA